MKSYKVDFLVDHPGYDFDKETLEGIIEDDLYSTFYCIYNFNLTEVENHKRLIKIRYEHSLYGLDIIQYDVIDEKTYFKLKEARDLGIEFYLSEIAGKYSETKVKFDDEFWELYVEVIDDLSEVSKFESMFPYGIVSYDVIDDVLLFLQEHQNENN